MSEASRSLVGPMTIPLQIDSDSWYFVEDRKKRKQIQDRLAQRARRRWITQVNVK